MSAHITFDDAMKLARIALEMGYRAAEAGESMNRAMHRLMIGDPHPLERVELATGKTLDHIADELGAPPRTVRGLETDAEFRQRIKGQFR